MTNQVGFCARRGTATESQPCSASDVDTGCAAGLLCTQDMNGNQVCLKQCDFFSSNPGCSSSQRCFGNSLCDQAGSYQQAGIGSACSSSAQIGDPCADDGLAWRGACVNLADPTSSQNLVCLRLCGSSDNCMGGQSCAKVFTSGLGVCH